MHDIAKILAVCVAAVRYDGRKSIQTGGLAGVQRPSSQTAIKNPHCYLKSVAYRSQITKDINVESREQELRDALDRVGEVLRRRREDVGLSQDELGHLCGLHRTYVGSVERGERNLSLSSLMAMARALQTSPHVVLQRAEL